MSSIETKIEEIIEGDPLPSDLKREVADDFINKNLDKPWDWNGSDLKLEVTEEMKEEMKVRRWITANDKTLYSDICMARFDKDYSPNVKLTSLIKTY